MRTEIRVTGVGGQGAITLGHIIGRAAALYDRKEVAVTEGYSPYITGGWSRADIVISDEPIDYPLVSRLDALITMYQEGLELGEGMVKPSGVILVEAKLVDASKYAAKRKVLAVPATDIAVGLGRKVLTNVVLLGSLMAETPAVSRESVLKALAERFPKAAELNTKAFDAGFAFAKAQGGIIVV
jgi:2-oxoglutarate ferredoxin oxidoreductase subunit gamma